MAAIAIGFLAFALLIFSIGSVSALFLWSLTQASAIFHSQSFLIYLLPLFGLLTGWVYQRFHAKIHNTTKILHQTHDEEALIPFLTGFLIVIFTVLSHLFGASVGRESTAVQFGASLGDFWRDLFSQKLSRWSQARQVFVRAGMAAGFGSVFGIPWAGAVFALEVTPSRRWPLRHLPVCLLASFGAHYVALAWGAHHKIYPAFPTLSWNWLLICKWVGLGIAFGLMARLFLFALHMVEKVSARVPKIWLRPALGGLFVMVICLCLQTQRYNGLGLPLIDDAMTTGVQTWDFAWKSLLTAISSGSGLKGGEVTPLMAIGSSFGFVLAGFLNLPSLYAACLGLISVFAACAHIPWTGAVMAWELFGAEAFLPTFVACWIARRVLGLHSLYIAKD